MHAHIHAYFALRALGLAPARAWALALSTEFITL